MVIGTLLENDDISRYFFIFLIFSFLGGKRAEKWPKMTKKSVCYRAEQQGCFLQILSVIPTLSHITFSWGIMFPNQPLSFQFHQEVVGLLFAHVIECHFQFSTCSNKVATIVASDDPNNSSPADESLECLNKAISGQTVCCLYMNSTAAQACKHCHIFCVFYSLWSDMAQTFLHHSS